jgi:hypothetical protein
VFLRRALRAKRLGRESEWHDALMSLGMILLRGSSGRGSLLTHFLRDSGWIDGRAEHS